MAKHPQNLTVPWRVDGEGVERRDRRSAGRAGSGSTHFPLPARRKLPTRGYRPRCRDHLPRRTTATTEGPSHQTQNEHKDAHEVCGAGHNRRPWDKNALPSISATWTAV